MSPKISRKQLTAARFVTCAPALPFFSDVEKSVKKQLQTIRSNPFLPRDIDVGGFVYDVRTGKLHEISEATE
jgi:carbonic anhydrase